MSRELPTRAPDFEGGVPSDEELMLWVDGELDPRRSHVVAAYVASDPRARAVVATLRLSGELIASEARRCAERAMADGIADGVMENIDAEASRRLVPRPRPLRRWGLPAATAFGFALAAAAAWVLALHSGITRTPMAELGSLSAMSLTEEAPVDDARTASIEVVDFGARPGLVFYVPTEGESMAVVWLTDDDTPGGVQ